MGLIGSVLAASAAMAEEIPEAVSVGLHKLFPTTPIDKITATPMPGLYEATLGSRLFYVSEDGKYLLQGNLYDIDTRTNLTEASQNAVRKAALDAVNEDEMVIFAPEDPKYTVTIFTDIDCGYCRKLHKEMHAYNEKGISVRYMFYPRSGVGSPSFDKAVSVWCADDRNQALTDAKNGKPVEPKTCENPIANQYALGGDLGLRGTPAIFLEDGESIPGYVPADRLAATLAAKDVKQN
jgi:thiol:disulfide interchange protein DsbC